MTKCVLGDYILDMASGPFGSNLKVECFVPSGFPIIDGANLYGVRVTDNVTKFVTEEKARSLSRSIAKRHDVIVTISGTLGQVAYIPSDSLYEEYLCSQRQFRVTFDESKIDVEYLVNLLHTDYGQKKILSFANYVGVPALSQPLPNFRRIELELPDIEKQHKVAKIISTIDRKIALNRKRIATLEAMAKEIYDYWFVQFDFPDAHGRPYKSSGGAMVYNPDLKREIPKGWAIKTVGDIANVVTGKEDASFATDDGMYPFFTCSQKVLKCDEYKFDGKNVLVAGNGEFCVKHYIGKCNAYQRTYVISPSNVNYWGAVYIEAQRAIDRFKSCSSGSIVKFITMGDVRGLIVYCPANIDLYDPINQCLEQIENQEREIVELSALRDFLLPVLMNGQVKVR